MNTIPIHSRWRFIGPGEGKNQIHRVLMACAEEVITTSVLDNTAATGFGWLGNPLDFIKCFQPL